MALSNSTGLTVLLRLSASCVALAWFATSVQGQATMADTADQPSKGGSLRQRISVKVNHLDDLLKDTDAAKTKPVLFLDGQEVKGVFGASVGSETLVFQLNRTSDNRDAWKPLLGTPSFTPRTVRLSVGVPGKTSIPSAFDFQLTVLHAGWVWGWFGLLVFLALIMCHPGTRGLALQALQESGPVPPGKTAALSLGRCQMAFWSVIVILAFIFLYMVTWDYDTITQGTLALIGISAGTGLAGAIVDSSKNSGMATEKTSLQTELAGVPPADAMRQQAITQRLNQIRTQMDTPLHTGFISDLLTDANGISFHRMQIFVWTIILGVIFAISVYNDLLMPDFSATLLGLMGISSGTYVGFKFPENKN